MSSDRPLTVGDLASALDGWFPSQWAEDWDRVGLIVGEPETVTSGILVTLDATAEAVGRAVRCGANVLVTHHPPYLDLPETVAASAGPAGTLEAALRAGVSVISLHTNLDRSPAGASALTDAIGLDTVGPLESAAEAVVLVTTFAPAGAVDDLRAAMASAGAGRLGEYDACAFAGTGTGYFEPRDGARPAVAEGSAGAPEVRLEMIAPPSRAGAVLEATRAVHPYEEPVILAFPCTRARGVARLGRVATWRDGATLGDLAGHVSAALGVSCRVWGDAARPVGRIAVANGSTGSLMADALRQADTLIAGEVRYHDALAAAASGLAIVEAGHDTTEWPLVRVLAEYVRKAVGDAVAVTEEPPAAGWWTMEEPNV